MPADVLREGMHNDIGTQLERATQVRGSDRIVDNQRHAVPVRNPGEFLNIDNIARRIAD